MNEKMQVFEYGETPVRTVLKDGEPWWVLTDVCKALGLSNPSKVASRLDDDEKCITEIHTPFGSHNMIIVSERGLYSVILRSTKPEAKPFHKWVTNLVDTYFKAKKEAIVPQMQVFEYGETPVRAVLQDGEPWFVGKDVAAALGYENTRDALAKHVDGEDKGVAKRDTPGGSQDVVIINESGVYALIFGSKLDSAKRFKHWVTSEVLPSIRKTGVYGDQNQEEMQRQAYRMALQPIRRELTDVIQEVDNGPWSYKKYTDLAYKSALGKNAAQLRKERGAPPKATAVDCMTADEIHAVAKRQSQIAVLLDMGLEYSEIKALVLKKPALPPPKNPDV